MTDDRSLERAARAWLEAGPTAAPDRAVDAALARVQTTSQERDLGIPWRPRTMFDRLAFAAVSAVLVIGALTLGASLITTPDNAAGPCPPTLSEADAIDTFVAGMSQAQRAWGIAGGTPAVRPGWIAGFADEPPYNNPGTVVLLDPATGTRCHLIRLATQHQIGVPVTSLDWSPSGDALALALAGAEGPDGQEDGVVLLWTPNRLLRIWSGDGSPRLEWAPDGRSIVLWSSDGSQGPDGAPGSFDTRLVFADGAPDRTFDLFPVDDSLRWSPDGNRWVVSEAIEQDIVPNTAVSIIDVADGRKVPMDIGTGHFRPIGWASDDSIIVQTIERGRGVTGILDVPIADPSAYRLLLGPDESLGSYARLSPDGARLLGISAPDERGVGDLRLIQLAAGPGDPTGLAPGMKAGDAGFAWAPDGSQVVFHVPDEGLWTVNADGSGLHQVAPSGIVAIDDPWQPVPLR